MYSKVIYESSRFIDTEVMDSIMTVSLKSSKNAGLFTSGQIKLMLKHMDIAVSNVYLDD